MLNPIDTTETLYTKQDAISVAAAMNASDDDWDYRPKHDPAGTGYSFIEIFDEDGNLVGKM